jgi:hypothetical protein
LRFPVAQSIATGDLVFAERPAIRRPRNAPDELACAEQRHLGVVFVAELVDLALVSLGEGAQHHLGLGVPVGRAGLVALAPGRDEAF